MAIPPMLLKQMINTVKGQDHSPWGVGSITIGSVGAGPNDIVEVLDIAEDVLVVKVELNVVVVVRIAVLVVLVVVLVGVLELELVVAIDELEKVL
jgi:hypothetical protein